MYQSLLGALDYEIVTSLFEVSLENLRKSQSLEQILKIESGALSEKLFQL